MGFSHQDRKEQRGRRPDVNLDRIRFGHRVDPRKKLSVSLPGQDAGEKEKPDVEDVSKHQLVLWW